MYTCTYISQLFVNCFLLFEALMEDWRVVKWVASWNKVFIIIIIYYYYFYYYQNRYLPVTRPGITTVVHNQPTL